MENERLLTAKEVSQILQICTKTVYKWARRGVIPSYRLPSNNIRFKLSEILEQGHYLSSKYSILEESKPTKISLLGHEKERKFEWEK